MTLLKVLALILGSAFFFPVSCTSTLFVGTFVIAHLDAREVARGDQVHPGFSIVVEPGENGQPFRSVRLSDLPRLRENGGVYSFLMSKPSGRIDINDYTHLTYRVLENQGSVQVIEVEDKDDDNTFCCRYRATHADVMPLASRMFYVGYMFEALPFAFGIAFGCDKFVACASLAIAREQAMDVAAELGHLEDIPDVRTLTARMTGTVEP